MPVTHPGEFWPNLHDFWAKNQAAADQELFHDIIPLSRPTITLAMSLRSEQLRVYQWVGFKQLRLVSYTLAIFLG
jgi:hypothetical protein